MAEETNRNLEGLDAGQLAALYLEAANQRNASEAERIMHAVPVDKMGEFGKAYLRQETRRVCEDCKLNERERVARLLQHYKNRIRQNEEPWWDTFADLEEAVREGWQRL